MATYSALKTFWAFH